MFPPADEPLNTEEEVATAEESEAPVESRSQMRRRQHRVEGEAEAETETQVEQAEVEAEPEPEPAPAEPEPEPAPVEQPPAVKVRKHVSAGDDPLFPLADAGKYYIGLWSGLPNYGCPYCSFSTVEHDGDGEVELHILAKIDAGDIKHRKALELTQA